MISEIRGSGVSHQLCITDKHEKERKIARGERND
jgi:hypothetical protein